MVRSRAPRHRASLRCSNEQYSCLGAPHCQHKQSKASLEYLMPNKFCSTAFTLYATTATAVCICIRHAILREPCTQLYTAVVAVGWQAVSRMPCAYCCCRLYKTAVVSYYAQSPICCCTTAVSCLQMLLYCCQLFHGSCFNCFNC